MVRRFVLADLTPNTRALYRAYLAACRYSREMGAAMDLAHSRQTVPATTLWHMNQNPEAYEPEARERTTAQLAAATAALNRATDAWRTAADLATEAFQAAAPAMEAEGYPRSWFNTPTGAMQIPRGEHSPGQFRRGRSVPVTGGDRVEIIAGDECGGWGTVVQVLGDEIHVGMYGSTTDVRVYSRDEIRKPRG